MKIEVKNISKKINNSPVLKHVSVTFESGKIYGITGDNDSGKSVFLKLLCSFYKVDEGSILKDGYCYSDKNEFPSDTRALIDTPYFFKELTGFENLKVIAKILNKINDETILEYMKIFDIYKDRNIQCGDYLYGMRQKLALSSVFMENPKVIILDSPFESIEDKVVDDIKEYFKSEKEKDKLIIIATKNIDELKDLADEIYEFNDGKLSKINVPSENESK